MSKELLLVAEALSNEKGVSKEIVIQAIESSIESATRKLIDENMGVRVELDPRTGEYDTFRYWDVVPDDEVTIPSLHVSLTEAMLRSPGIQVGDKIEEPMPSIEFGRIAAQSARQVMFHKLREAERELVIEQFKNKLGQLVYGTVKKVTRGQHHYRFGWKSRSLYAAE